MSALSIQPSYPIFTDTSGQPLEAGHIWVGQANLNPQVNPKQVYWDKDLTIPAAQPIRTLGGYPSRNGTPAMLYTDGDFSVVVTDKNGSLIYSALSATLRLSSNVITSVSAGVVLFDQGSTYVNGTVGKSLKARPVNIKDAPFNAVGDGVADDSLAFSDFIDYCATTGAKGEIPPGVYSVSPSIRTFVSPATFTIAGAGRGATILRNRDTGNSFIYWTGCSGITFEDLSIDGSFTGLPSVPTSGATVGLVNTNNVTFRRVDFRNIWRTAILAFNDHQTTPANVYRGLTIDSCQVYGPSNYIDDLGPSAFLVADMDDSTMSNCYIENIGQYGYEFKNDCNNTSIVNCLAFRTYRAFYLGGDGAQVALRYVKNSLIANCIAEDCVEALTFGKADNNLVSGVEIRTTAGGPVALRAAISLSDSNGNCITGVHIVGRKSFACDIRDVSAGNSVDFSLADTTYVGEAVAVNVDSTGNRVSINWKNHSGVVLNKARFPGQARVEDQLAKFRYMVSAETNPRIEDAISTSRPSYASSVKGRLQYGDTFDVYTATTQASLFEYFGNFTSPLLSQVRHRFDVGLKLETIFAADGLSSVSYTKSQTGFIPSPDGTINLGSPSGRWGTVYAVTGTINTSDAREKQQIRNLSAAEQAVSVKLRTLLRAFKFNDAVAAKGDGARIHFGVLAQDVISAFASEGLDASKYALLCHDSWSAIPAELGEDGTILTPAQEAGERYGVRYEELLSFILSTM